MKTFKQFNEHSKETDWTSNLTEPDFKSHLDNLKVKKIFTGMVNHPMFKDYHFGGAVGGARIYKHKIDEDGFHQIKTINSNTPSEYLHFITSKHGKVYTVNHNKITKDESGNNIISRVKSFNL